MKIAIASLLSAFSLVVAGENTSSSSLIVGRSLAEKKDDILSTMEQLETGASMLAEAHGRRLSGSPYDKVRKFIKCTLSHILVTYCSVLHG